MKVLNRLFIILFCALLVLPLITFNAQPEQASPIDNAQLPEWPTVHGRTWADYETVLAEVKQYFNLRLGFREESILFYQQMNDRLFDQLIHPLYVYGKDKEVFFEFGYEMEDFDYVALFTDFVAQMQTYCQERGIAFTFALNPAKPQLYPEYLPDGVQYRFRQYAQLTQDLREKGVRFIDFQEPLLIAKAQGRVYNRQYDPGHWNEYGEFSAISALLEEMGLAPLRSDAYEVGAQEVTSLPVSYFPISEQVPTYRQKQPEAEPVDHYGDALRVSPIFPEHSYFVNANRPDAPRILVLHGSHFASAPKFLADSFSEALFVYSYGTIFDLPYYVNLFDPDIVLFEAAAQIISDSEYFRRSLLETVRFEPPWRMPDAELAGTFAQVAQETVENSSDANGLTSLSFTVSGPVEYAYLRLGERTLDVERLDEAGDWQITLETGALHAEEEPVLLLISEEGQWQEVPIIH